ncbi:response regulator transcription factor [Lederbergia wuyishanensis]|uniref:CheY-like chemotaxis protein n=1 Tax=Lederbergia wuyishanensis TaxID=1347903 RepID=A0ABU0D5V3_9BACI|nr:response regulator [Lederbergia wuyishanensis]MCJ8008377.1 response regulator [Lederbergia wuyishanensis]MDQ0343791.1 CheY-like chemotaxis protein [Lederbergia wuyishanensis]
MKKILVVDDEEILRMLIVDTLEDSGYIIHEAPDGLAALEQLQKENYDLMILDYMMPSMTGIEVLTHIPSTLRVKLKVLMLTAKTQEKDKQEMLKAGTDFFMAKPFSPLDLMSVVEEILQ